MQQAVFDRELASGDPMAPVAVPLAIGHVLLALLIVEGAATRSGSCS